MIANEPASARAAGAGRRASSSTARTRLPPPSRCASARAAPPSRSAMRIAVSGPAVSTRSRTTMRPIAPPPPTTATVVSGMSQGWARLRPLTSAPPSEPGGPVVRRGHDAAAALLTFTPQQGGVSWAIVTSWAPPSRALSAIVVPIVVLIDFPRFAGTAEAASAVPVLVSLDYATDPPLADCPSAADFSQSVIRQLGHDPFRPSAPRHLVVRLSAKGGRLAGLVEWRDAADQWEGERTFSSRNETCAQLVRTMALATAVQIQLLARLQEMGGEAETPSEAEVKPPVE